MFQIGVAPMRVNRKKRPLKKREESVLETITPFQPYTGPRWQIPSGLSHLSDRVQHTFRMVETYAIPEVFLKIKQRQVSFLNIFNPTRYHHFYPRPDWIPPSCVKSMIQSYYDIQCNELKYATRLYMKLYLFTRQIKKLVHCHRIYKSLKNVKNTCDPVTLEIPVKPVYVLDYENGLSYVYEASTLRKTIENRILFSDYMFPEPKPPVNLLSNEPFTTGQLFSIIDACKAHGEFSWILDRFKKVCECDLDVFESRFRQDLKIEAIDSYFKCQKESAKESVIDYFDSYAETIGLDERIAIRFTIQYDKSSRASKPFPYIQSWIKLARQYYIAVELKDAVELHRIKMESVRRIKEAVNIFRA